MAEQPEVPTEETFDPADWESTRALGHRILDDALDYVETLRDRPAWLHAPPHVKAHFQGPPAPRSFALRGGLPGIRPVRPPAPDREQPTYDESEFGKSQCEDDVRILADAYITSRQWQVEPDEEGWYWVEGFERPRYVWRFKDKPALMYRWQLDSQREEFLNGRRVCRITKPPEPTT